MMIETGITSEGDWSIGDVIVNNKKNCIALIYRIIKYKSTASQVKHLKDDPV